MFWFFGHGACGILGPWPGIKPTPPALEGKVLTLDHQGSPYHFQLVFYSCCCQVTSVVSDSVWPHRRQPTRLPRPWDSPGKNIGVGYHFLLQCMKVKSESEVAQSCPTLNNPMDCSLPGSSVHGIFQARVFYSSRTQRSKKLRNLPRLQVANGRRGPSRSTRTKSKLKNRRPLV